MEFGRVCKAASDSKQRVIQNKAVNKRARGDCVVVGLQNRDFTELKSNDNHTGYSLMCMQCKFEKNIYHVKSGKLSNEEAQQILLKWEECCPGAGYWEAHKEMGGTLLRWYAEP